MDIKLEGNFLKVIVKPNSLKNEVLGFDSNKHAYKIAIAQVADKGKANSELLKFLYKTTKTRFEIKSGKTSKEKLLKIL